MKGKNIGTAKLKTYIHVTRITIAICWVALFAFWAIKLFGGNFFEIVVQNENFIAFSQKVETAWLKYFISFVTTFVYNYLQICAVCQKYTFKKRQFLLVILAILSMWYVANFSNSEAVKMWYGYILIVFIPLFLQKGWKKTYGILCVVLDLVFSILSLYTRNVPLCVTENYLLAFVLIIDMYIMVLLYYLYMNLKKCKEISKNGNFVR